MPISLRTHAPALLLLSFSAVLHAASATKMFENTPLAFEPNHGQWTASGGFGTHAPGFSALFSSAGTTYLLSKDGRQATLQSKWIGASASATVSPLGQLPGVAHYYLGSDEKRWISGLPTYGRLLIEGLYPGIDVVYYGDSRQQLEYDIEVAPGADPGRIRLAFSGEMTGRPRVDAKGDLHIPTRAGAFMQRRPVAYQEIDGRPAPVEARFVVHHRGEVTIALGAYDRRRKLVIDPTIAWTAFPKMGTANAIAIDPSGNVLVAGTTFNPDNAVFYPNTPAYPTDAVLTKFKNDGTILYTVTFGGSDADSGLGLAVDPDGNAIVVGNTSSKDFVTKNAYQADLRGNIDAFIAKFSPTGDLLFSTHFGGSAGAAANAVTVDATGRIYVIGSTSASGYPIVAPAYQPSATGCCAGFLAKFSADGSTLEASTFLPAGSPYNPSRVALGPDGSIYLASATFNLNQPTSANAFQKNGVPNILPSAYLMRLDPSATGLIYATYFGTGTLVAGIEVDREGSLYLTGNSSGLPLQNAWQPNFSGPQLLGVTNGFLAKLNAEGSALEFSTYLGSGTATGVGLDPSGNVVVVGSSGDAGFPTLAAFRPQPAVKDGFVMVFDRGGDTLLFSSFVGGSGADSVQDVAVDRSGAIYLAGATSSPDFDPNFLIGPQAFVAKLSGPTVAIPVTFNTDPPGFLVTVDGASRKTPVSLSWAPGVLHRIAAPVQQITPGLVIADFVSWSNGGANPQNLVTPAEASSYTAKLKVGGCQFNIAAFETIFGQTGGGGGINVDTQPGCPRTSISSNVPWIKLYLPLPGTGPFFVQFSVLANPDGGTRSGAITIGSNTFTITQTYTAPTVYSSCCDASRDPSSASVTVSYQINDADGPGDIKSSSLLINSSLDPHQACLLTVDPIGEMLYLAGDDGGLFANPMPLYYGLGVGTISNSQCAIDGSKTTASQTGLNVAINFKPSFAGSKIIYVAATDKEGLTSGWVQVGTWNVPEQTPNAESKKIAQR